MAKYSYELKRTVVKEYLKGKSSVEDLALKYNIKSHTAVFNWIHAFEALGEEGLKPSRRQKHYPSDFKEFIVKSYLENEMSYQKNMQQTRIKESFSFRTLGTRVSRRRIDKIRFKRRKVFSHEEKR